VFDEAGAGDRLMCAQSLRASEGIPILALTESGVRLAKELARRGALPEKATVDAFHIGIAAAHQVTSPVDVERQAPGQRDDA
jgi:hypothetical protein